VMSAVPQALMASICKGLDYFPVKKSAAN
jgi:hypothetical protein